jgi:hypothetical protein
MRAVKDIIGSVKKTGKKEMQEGVKTLKRTMKRVTSTISHATGSGKGLHRSIGRKSRSGS